MGAMACDILCRLTEKGDVLGMWSFTRWELSAGSKFLTHEFSLRGTTVIHVRR